MQDVFVWEALIRCLDSIHHHCKNASLQWKISHQISLNDFVNSNMAKMSQHVENLVKYMTF